MDSGQRHRFIKQFLKLTSDPERRRLASDLLSERENQPRTTDEPEVKKRISRLWESTSAWGAISVLAAFMISQLSLKFVFVLVWGTLWVDFVRAEIFSRKWPRRIGQIAVGVALAVFFIEVWPYAKPKVPATLDQQADVVIEKAAKKFPWLANPPKQNESKPASTVVVSSEPKLKITLTSGTPDNRMLILDNTKGASKLQTFIITGLEYYLDMNGVAMGQAIIQQRGSLPGPLNFDPFDIEKGATKRFNLNEGQSAIAIHMHDPKDGAFRAMDSVRRYICLRIVFTQTDTAETFVHYQVMSPYGDLFLMAEQPEHSGSGPPQKAGDEGWPYSIVRVIKEDARRYYGTEYREYQR